MKQQTDENSCVIDLKFVRTCAWLNVKQGSIVQQYSFASMYVSKIHVAPLYTPATFNDLRHVLSSPIPPCRFGSSPPYPAIPLFSTEVARRPW